MTFTITRNDYREGPSQPSWFLRHGEGRHECLLTLPTVLSLPGVSDLVSGSVGQGSWDVRVYEWTLVWSGKVTEVTLWYYCFITTKGNTLDVGPRP